MYTYMHRETHTSYIRIYVYEKEGKSVYMCFSFFLQYERNMGIVSQLTVRVFFFLKKNKHVFFNHSLID